MADFAAAYADMDDISQQLKTAHDEIQSTLDGLQSKVEHLTSDGFRTQVASGKFNDGYHELTSSLKQALEGVQDMGEGLQQMRQKIEDLDHQLAGG